MRADRCTVGLWPRVAGKPRSTCRISLGPALLEGVATPLRPRFDGHSIRLEPAADGYRPTGLRNRSRAIEWTLAGRAPRIASTEAAAEIVSGTIVIRLPEPLRMGLAELLGERG